MEHVVKKPARMFGGKTENFENKEEKVFYQRMLRAYLKGSKHFYFGKDSVTNAPKQYDVLVIIPEKNESER